MQRLLFILIFSAHFAPFGTAQSLDQLISFADLQYEQGLYQLAAKEYQRVLFFGAKDQVGELNYATGNCYFQLQNLELAERHYRMAMAVLKDSLKSEALLRKASCLILKGNYNRALLDLFRHDCSKYPKLYKNKHILIGTAYFGLEDFEKSESHYITALGNDDPDKPGQIERLFDKRALRKPNPKLAMILSIVVPGAGQLYSGDIKNGINSIVLTSGLLFLAYQIAIRQSYWDALFSVFPWFNKALK